MGSDLIRAVVALTRRLAELAERDDGLRDDLRALVAVAARELGPLAAPAAVEASPVAEPEHCPAAEGIRPAAEPPDPVDDRPPLIELTLGRTPPPEPALPARKPPGSVAGRGDDLGDVEARCRLKAEGMRWAAERLELRDRGVDIGPRDREVLDRGKALGHCLWMNMPEFAVPARGGLGEEAAGSFEALADAVALARRIAGEGRAGREHVEPALHLLAEAQSALRVAVLNLGRRDEPDQNRVFKWLRAEAEQRQIYVARHMKLEDPADPAAHADLKRRVAERARLYGGFEGHAKREEALFKKLLFHASRIGKGGGDDRWYGLAAAVDELVGLGVPPSNVRIRDVLLPLLDDMPDLGDLPAGFVQAYREVGRYRATVEEDGPTPAPRPPSPEVAEVARLLEGQSVLLVGGGPHEKSRRALEKAFHLKEVIWDEVREHGPIEGYEPFIARPEVALVLLAIRWSSHSFEGVKEFCHVHGKPMVRLPGGYNPNQVAVQVLAQVSRQLERALADRAAAHHAPALPAMPI